MAKFNYRLQTLLNVKKQMEDKAKNELANSIQVLYKEQQKLQVILDEKDSCCERVIRESAEGLNVHRFMSYSRYLNAVHLQMNNQHENVNSASRDVDIFRERLVGVAKEKKMLEKLKDKKLQEYKYDELKIEEKRVEEVVSYKYINS